MVQSEGLQISLWFDPCSDGKGRTIDLNVWGVQPKVRRMGLNVRNHVVRRDLVRGRKGGWGR